MSREYLANLLLVAFDLLFACDVTFCSLFTVPLNGVGLLDVRFRTVLNLVSCGSLGMSLSLKLHFNAEVFFKIRLFFVFMCFGFFVGNTFRSVATPFD